MCGRFVLKATPAELITRFGLDECVDLKLRYNIPFVRGSRTLQLHALEGPQNENDPEAIQTHTLIRYVGDCC